MTKMFHKKLKSTLEEIDIANEEEYPLRNSDFAIKQREQKLMMKLHYQHRPLTPRRIPIVKHIRETLQRENVTLHGKTVNKVNARTRHARTLKQKIRVSTW